MDDFELKVQAQIRFIEVFGARESAELSVHLQETINGLAKNNASFTETYHQQVREIRKLREALAFYADYKNWVTHDEDSYPAAWKDCGQRARDARGLEPAPETEE